MQKNFAALLYNCNKIFINVELMSYDMIGSLSEQEAEDFISKAEFRTAFLTQSLINACKSRRVLRAVLTRLAKENIIGCINDLDSLVAQSIPSDDHFDNGLDHEGDESDSDLSGDDIPDVDSLLQMEVFNSSAVKNIGRFNCEFLRYEKLGQGGFGCAYRVHHLVDEKDYCVKELHLSIQKFEGSMPHMIAYARGVLREVMSTMNFAICRSIVHTRLGDLSARRRFSR